MGKKYKILQDQIGRNIIGTVVEETATTITLNNPVILHLEIEQTGQIQVQTFPILFFELLQKDKLDSNNWTYTKSNVVVSDAVLSANIISQYERINTPAPKQPETSPKVISINDID